MRNLFLGGRFNGLRGVFGRNGGRASARRSCSPLLCLLACFFLPALQLAVAQTNTASVITDKADYSPGSTVIITGSGFAPGETVQCQVLRVDIDENSGPEHLPWLVTNDAGGGFVTTWLVTPDELGATLQLTAKGATSHVKAQATFTDGNDYLTVTISGSPTVGTAFNVVVDSHQNGNGGASQVSKDTTITLSLASGTGTLAGTLTGVMAARTSQVTFSGVTYSKAEPGVSIKASASGGDTRTAGTSSTFTINQVATTTTLARHSGTPATSTYGNSLLFDAFVSGANPSGTITLKDGGTGGTTIGIGTLSGGTCTITPTANALTAGTHNNIIAVYSGDSTYAGSTSGAISQVVNQKPLTPSITLNNKIYDGTTVAATIANRSLVGIVNGDDVNLGTSGTVAPFSSKNVNSYAGISITGLGLSGTTAGNYQLSSSSAYATASITAKALSITSPLLASKVYNATVAAGALTVGTLAGFVGTETVTATGVAANYSSANVGSYNNVAVSYTLHDGANGGMAANYALADGLASGQITAKPLTVSGITANSKAYDGTTAATLNLGSAALVGNLDGGNVALNTGSATGNFAPNGSVGAGKNVQVSGLTISGSASGNYTLTQPTANADVTAKALRVSGLSVPMSKTYDGTTAAVVSGTPKLQSAEHAGAGSTSDGTPYDVDSVNLTGTATATYDSKDVKSAAGVTFAGLALTGTGSGNYFLVPPTQSASITPAATTVSVQSSQNPALPTDTPNFMASVTVPGVGSAVPTGTVQFTTNGTPQSDAITLGADGTATLPLPAASLSHGSNTVSVVYANTDGNFVTGSTGNLTPKQVVNRPPGAVTNNVTTPFNTVLSFAASALAGVGYDPEGDSMSVTAVGHTSQSGSSVVLDANGNINYNPPSNFSGQDSFTYTQTDQYGGSTTCALKVFVNLGAFTSVIKNVQPLADGHKQLVAYGIPGRPYHVQVTSDASGQAGWTDLGPTTADAQSGVIVFIDPDTTQHDVRLYRLALP